MEIGILLLLGVLYIFAVAVTEIMHPPHEAKAAKLRAQITELEKCPRPGWLAEIVRLENEVRWLRMSPELKKAPPPLFGFTIGLAWYRHNAKLADRAAWNGADAEAVKAVRERPLPDGWWERERQKPLAWGLHKARTRGRKQEAAGAPRECPPAPAVRRGSDNVRAILSGLSGGRRWAVLLALLPLLAGCSALLGDPASVREERIRQTGITARAKLCRGNAACVRSIEEQAEREAMRAELRRLREQVEQLKRAGGGCGQCPR